MKYQIVTNGINYRVQWLGKTHILRRLKWYWLYYDSYAGRWIAEFDTETTAREAIAKKQKVDIAQKQGYLPL